MKTRHEICLKTCFQINSKNNLWGIATLFFHLGYILRDVFCPHSYRIGPSHIPGDQGRVLRGRYTFQNYFCENDTALKNRTPLTTKNHH